MSILGFDQLFPTVVGNCSREDLIEPTTEIINGLDESEWREFGTASVHILDKYEDIKKEITKETKMFLQEVMQFDTDIQMTTSWFTKATNKNQFEPHDHNNSWYSGVFYMQDNCEIQFSSITPQIFVNNKSNNLINSLYVDYTPSAGTMYLFPSKTLHRVKPYQREGVRHSLAFNFMPVGLNGVNDSSFNYIKKL